MDHNTALQYTQYKQHWDTLPDAIKDRINSILHTNQSELNRDFNLGYTMGFNTALAHALTWVTVALRPGSENTELLGVKDTISWTLIRLFLIQYELALLEQEEPGSVN